MTEDEIADEIMDYTLYIRSKIQDLNKKKKSQFSKFEVLGWE